MPNTLNIIILAAGKGTRMKSKKLKVLHPLAGSTIIDRVLDTSKELKPSKIIMIYGHQGEQLKSHLVNEKITWVEQKNPQGTGHAVQLAMPYVDNDAKVLVLVGDAPLILTVELQALLNFDQAVLTANIDNPYGYGRIHKDASGLVEYIVEEKDATQTQKKINEINSGIIMARAEDMNKWIQQINANNAQKELYLTDILALAHADNKSFHSVISSDHNSIKGINDRKQLAECESLIQSQLTKQLMLKGAYLPVPETVQIRGQVICGKDVVIDTGVILEGHNDIAEDVEIGAYSIIKNCKLGTGTRIAPHSMLEDVITKGECDIGPYARLRPGTVIGKKAKVGNFVETKKTIIGENSKASHLTYLGDCEIGDHVNIGAGTITCNYDGINKFKTIIQDGAFIGSDTQLIAPVTIGKGATIGAGSTITKDTPADTLTLSRTKQKSLPDWQKPTKK